MPTPGFIYSSEKLNSFQIIPQLVGCIGDQLLISGREQGDFQLGVFEVPPADDGSVHKNSRTDDSGEVEDVPHMLLGQEQAFCFFIAQYKLIKASQEQTGGNLCIWETVIDVEITASGFKYYVENADGTDSSALNLTTKNRLQFTTEFTRDKLKGKHMLAFTAMKRNNSWIVSDNYVDYNFVNVFNFE